MFRRQAHDDRHPVLIVDGTAEHPHRPGDGFEHAVARLLHAFGERVEAADSHRGHRSLILAVTAIDAKRLPTGSGLSFSAKHIEILPGHASVDFSMPPGLAPPRLRIVSRNARPIVALAPTLPPKHAVPELMSSAPRADRSLLLPAPHLPSSSPSNRRGTRGCSTARPRRARPENIRRGNLPSRHSRRLSRPSRCPCAVPCCRAPRGGRAGYCASMSRTSASVGGTTGKPSVQPALFDNACARAKVGRQLMAPGRAAAPARSTAVMSSPGTVSPRTMASNSARASALIVCGRCRSRADDSWSRSDGLACRAHGRGTAQQHRKRWLSRTPPDGRGLRTH